MTNGQGTPAMTGDLMRYDLRIQNALRGVVRTILVDIARNGLPGDHHFFIAFKTNAAGVQMSDRLRREYPDEMTIVLQHQFWDLHVGERDFEVGLSFKNIPEKLVVPFNAVCSFIDPHVQFALKFEVETGDKPAEVTADAPTRPRLAPAKAIDKSMEADAADALTTKPTSLELARPSRNTRKGDRKLELHGDAAAGEKAQRDTKTASAPKSDDALEGSSEAADDNRFEAKIITLDAFRKKSE